jgi:anti-sigma factor RsiW
MAHLDERDLERYVDGELGRRRSRAVAAHLETCETCTAAVDAIRGVGALLRTMADELADGAPLDGLADRVLAEAKRQAPLPWTERALAWLGEFGRHQKKIWVPSLATATAAAVAIVVFVSVGSTPPATPEASMPPGSAVLSVSFGQDVGGTLFQLEDKDGSTTAVIWVDEGEPGSEVKRT